MARRIKVDPRYSSDWKYIYEFERKIDGIIDFFDSLNNALDSYYESDDNGKIKFYENVMKGLIEDFEQINPSALRQELDEIEANAIEEFDYIDSLASDINYIEDEINELNMDVQDVVNEVGLDSKRLEWKRIREISSTDIAKASKDTVKNSSFVKVKTIFSKLLSRGSQEQQTR